jgi:hypothetical protein
MSAMGTSSRSDGRGWLVISPDGNASDSTSSPRRCPSGGLVGDQARGGPEPRAGRLSRLGSHWPCQTARGTRRSACGRRNDTPVFQLGHNIQHSAGLLSWAVFFCTALDRGYISWVVASYEQSRRLRGLVRLGDAAPLLEVQLPRFWWNWSHGTTNG